MKKTIYKFIFPLSILFAISSCESILDQRPIDEIDVERAFENAADVDAGILGAYSAVSIPYLNVASLASDEVRRSNENRGQGAQVHNWTYTSDAGNDGGWNANYNVINRVNRVLDAIARLKAQGVLGATEVNAQEAEAYALRAMAHFDLWRLYSTKYDPTALGIPLVTLADTDGNGRPDGLDPFFKPSRATTAEVFQAVESDLEKAQGLMPAASNNRTRFTLPAIHALRARVALYKEDWAAAEGFASQALSAVPLEAPARFADIFADATNDGVILKMRRVIGDARVGTIWRDINGDVFFHPSNNLVSIFNPTADIRYASTIWVDPSRGTGGNIDPQRTLVAKYRGGAGAVALNDIKVFRSAEMLLIRAEARARKSSPDLIGASQDLSTLRMNRIAGSSAEVFTSANAIIQEVLFERRKELAFEGHRFLDLKRNGLGVTRTEQDTHINGTLPAADPRFAFPIPQFEIFANPNITQNPGYN